MNAHPVVIHRLLAQAVLAGTCVVMASCASNPPADPGVARVRGELRSLQADSRLATQAPVAMQQAKRAVEEAELLSEDPTLVSHRVYIAERRVQTAKALAEAQYAVTARVALSEQSDQVRLDARTREADNARSATALAKNDASAARAETGAAQARNDALVAELAALNAKKTDRGVQLTLGDVLFSSGRAELAAGSQVNLDKLVTALAASPDRRLIIEGFTDSQGSDAMNMALSQRRADAVANYLSSHGIARDRIIANGRGEAFPIAGNEIPSGRQLNRRVEVTIQDPPA